MMRTGIGIIALIAMVLTVAGMGGVHRACSQDEEPTNQAHFHYTHEGVPFGEKDGEPIKYKGPIHVEAYAVAPAKLRMRSEGLPLAVFDKYPHEFSSETIRLPHGTYEVHFSARVGGQLYKTIKRMVIDSRNQPRLQLDLADSKLFKYGSDMTALEMQINIKQLQEEMKALRAEVAELKK